jgi:hypothetical protein
MATKSLKSIRDAVVKTLAPIEAALVKLDEEAAGLQIRYGIALVPLKEATGKTWKVESAKVSKRPYGTLNRWANAGRIAVALDYNAGSKDLPPVQVFESLFRFIRDARTPEAFAEGVEQARKVLATNAEKGTSAIVKAAEKAKPNGSGSGNGSGGSGSGNNGGEGGGTTVTLDPAELEAAVEAVSKVIASQDQQLKRKLTVAWFDENKATIRAIRSGMLRVLEAHDATAVAVALGVEAKAS